MTPTDIAGKVVAELRRELVIDLNDRRLLAAVLDRLGKERGQAAALIESQRAELEDLSIKLALAGPLYSARQVLPKLQAAEARVSALEAEKAASGDVLMDPVAVHLNMLRGWIAKPSVDNIAHLYPEIWAMKEALIATLKHFRHPTSAEHETRDKVMAALAPFGQLPLPRPQALSRSSTEVKNDG